MTLIVYIIPNSRYNCIIYFINPFLFLPLEFPSLTENFLDVMKNGEMAVHADIHLQTTSTKEHNGVWSAPTSSFTFFFPSLFLLK